MVVFVLAILLSGEPLKYMVFTEKDACVIMGSDLIQTVTETIPERGKRITFTCDSALFFANAKP